MSDNSKTGTFRVWLPTFKQGDDFSKVATDAKDAAEAFKNLSDLYFEIGQQCRRVAGVLFENPGFTADGSGHSIYVEGPRGPMLPLVQEGIAQEEVFEEEEECTQPNIQLKDLVPEDSGEKCILNADPWTPFGSNLTGWWTKSR